MWAASAKVLGQIGKSLSRIDVKTNLPTNLKSVRSISGCAKNLFSLPTSSTTTGLCGDSLKSFTQVSRPFLQPSSLSVCPVRTRTYYRRTNGQPATVNAVVQRFFRLHNGMWIRTKAGRNKRKWKKSPARIARSQEHLFCNRAQCQLLDKMVNPIWKKPRYYLNDPYEPYHSKYNLRDYKYKKPHFLP